MPQINLIKVLHPTASEIKAYKPWEFESAMQLSFLPNLTFSEGKVFDKVTKLCYRAHEKGLIEMKQKWLGALFADDIECGAHLNFEIRWIDGKVGYGVFSTEDLMPFTFVGEYTGEVRKRRREDKKNSYCFDYSIGGERTSYIIDAEKKGNITRFINHSQRPNLEPISVYSGGVMHVILLTKSWIRKGEQLTYDYGEDYWKKREAPVSF